MKRKKITKCRTWPYCKGNISNPSKNKKSKGIFFLGMPGYGGPLVDDDTDIDTDIDSGDSGDFGGDGMGESLELVEAKREVRRYYLKPQGIWCSNKLEVLKALIEIGTNDCVIYTLKNLEDNDDVHKLSNNDIIYYYEDGILYDKNKVRVMDYELKIGHEEKRPKLADNASDRQFLDAYEDRITDQTIVEEYENYNFDESWDLTKRYCKNCGEEFTIESEEDTLCPGCKAHEEALNEEVNEFNPDEPYSEESPEYWEYLKEIEALAELEAQTENEKNKTIKKFNLPETEDLPF